MSTKRDCFLKINFLTFNFYTNTHTHALIKIELILLFFQSHLHTPLLDRAEKEEDKGN